MALKACKVITEKMSLKFKTAVKTKKETEVRRVKTKNKKEFSFKERMSNTIRRSIFQLIANICTNSVILPQ